MTPRSSNKKKKRDEGKGGEPRPPVVVLPPPPSSSSSILEHPPPRGTGAETATTAILLDELAALEYSHDEEIDEDCAFDAEDEAAFGTRLSSPKIRSGNVTVSVSLSPPRTIFPPPFSSSSSKVVATSSLEIARGSQMTLSTACLDVDRCDYDRIKLEYRCVYPPAGEYCRGAGRDDDDDDDVDDFACLCNYLSAKNGGMGLMPCTTIGLNVFGPCRVEFRVDAVAPGGCAGGGAINVFGIVAPLPRDCEDGVASRADVGVGASSAFRRSDSTFANGDDAGDIHDVAGTSESGKTGHRAVDDGAPSAGPPPSSDGPTGDAGTLPPTKGTRNDNKMLLTKKERKKLAREKAEQLEETLSAARGERRDDATSGDASADADADDDVGDEPAKKKSKKGKKDSDGGGPNDGDSSRRRTTSLTRERRLAGGLIVSDMLLGDGAPVKPGKRISLHYTGSLRSTGKVFDKNNSKQHPLVFRQGTGEVIRGLERGLEGMKAGGERVITIPSKLGYGSKGSGLDIPPDSDLVFEVKVLKVG